MVAAQPAHYQAGIHAYRVALDERKDWHAAVSAAIEAALERKAYDDGKPDAERLYRVPFYPVLPVLYIVGAAAVLVILFAYRPATTWPGLVIVLAGMLIYLGIRRRSA